MYYTLNLVVSRWILTSLGILGLVLYEDYRETGFRGICAVCLKSRLKGVYHPLSKLR